MSVVFDYRPAQAVNSRHRGVGRYTRSLAQALMGRSADIRIRSLIADGAASPFPAVDTMSVRVPRRPARLHWVLDWLSLKEKLERQRVQLFHATDLLALPRAGSFRRVVSAHDLIPLIFPQAARQYPIDYRLGLQRAWKQLARCDLVLVPSQHTGDDMCRLLNLDPQRISVVMPGREAGFTPLDRESCRREVGVRFGIEAPYLLYVGGCDHRKNVAFLIRAFSEIARGQYDGHLVLVGELFAGQSGEVRQLRSLVQGQGLEERIHFPGFVTDEHLVQLYNAADLFVFPSLYEGFGLPCLEALACGTAVLASDRSSIPEVCGETAVYFDPESIDSFVEAFGGLDSDTLNRLREAGPTRADRFDWNRAAERVLTCYRRLLRE